MNEKKKFSTIDDLLATTAKLPDIQKMRIGEAVMQLITERREVTIDTIMDELVRAASGEASGTGKVDHAAKEAWVLISASLP